MIRITHLQLGQRSPQLPINRILQYSVLRRETSVYPTNTQQTGAIIRGMHNSFFLSILRFSVSLIACLLLLQEYIAAIGYFDCNIQCERQLLKALQATRTVLSSFLRHASCSIHTKRLILIVSVTSKHCTLPLHCRLDLASSVRIVCLNAWYINLCYSFNVFIR